MLSGGLQRVAMGWRLIFIFGLILTILRGSQQKKENCTTVFAKYGHCERQPDGVHELNCFGEHNRHSRCVCVWKPGNKTSEKTYAIIIIQQHKQQPRCDVYNVSSFSQDVFVDKKYNMTAMLVVIEESRDCKKSVFSGSPKSLLRCGPPPKVSFGRQSEKLNLNVSWLNTAVGFYSVRYKVVDSPWWSETQSQCRNTERCTVEHLNTSLSYNVQIQCVTNEKCTLCPWSEVYTVPPELTTQPVLVEHEVTDVTGQRGSRLLSLKWKYSSEGQHDGYSVTVSKSSEEPPREQLSVTQPQISLVLSYSGYQLYISAVNNASTSPAMSCTVPRRELSPVGEAKLTVSVHSNTSLTLHWKDDLIKTYVCYCAEWSKEGQKTEAMSFYQDEMNNRTLKLLPAKALEPYKRYTMSLHTRPQKQTCNIRHLNSSESTYTSTQFYFKEGPPVAAPNVTISNISLKSVVLQWTAIPEADVRGFLLGYFIHYGEYLNQGVSAERNVTVDPTSESYELGGLKAGTTYQIQVSGFTSAGAGVRSSASLVKTLDRGYFHLNFIVPIVFFTAVPIVLIFGSLIVKRAKVLLWPSIPHPGKSSAIQKMETPCEMELLASIETLRVEEWDTDGLEVMEKDNAVLPGHIPFFFPLLSETEEAKDSSEITQDWIQTDAEEAAEDDNATAPTTNFQTPTFVFSSDYTTMEMFQQVMPKAPTAVNAAVTQDTVEAGFTSGHVGHCDASLTLEEVARALV